MAGNFAVDIMTGFGTVKSTVYEVPYRSFSWGIGGVSWAGVIQRQNVSFPS
jgi:hypothetical protein